MDTRRSESGTLTYVGPGGNIGSHAVIALARAGVCGCVTLVDPDRYEARNLRAQAITPRDVGRRKVDVLARAIRRIAPGTAVRTFALPVEAVPLGLLRADVIAAGLDGLEARRTVSRAARRLGVPFVDAGVNGAAQLARVTVYDPAPESACAECAWGPQELARLDRRYPCDAAAPSAPTGAPAHLGALAASLQCAEIVKLLDGDAANALRGCELVVGIAAHSHQLSRRQRAAGCPFDHRRWRIERIDRRACDITLARALALLPGASRGATRLRVHGDVFVLRLRCPRCGATVDTLGLARRLDARGLRCPRCAGVMVATGIDLADTLTLAHARGRRVSLAALGLRAGDVFSVEGERSQAHFEIGG